jgi:single-stranded-DNA-specific exonuclease
VELDIRPFLDLVAIGTIADVAPLDGDNRALVRAGLSMLAGSASRPRPGLRALAELAKIDLTLPMRGEDIGFRIAPRLNAPGRLGDPDLALQLLLETNPATAAGIAATLEQISLQRRAITEQITMEAFADIDANGWASDAGIVVARNGWHPGIVGIVAGRIATRYGRPTIVVGIEGDRGRGSVRGPSGARLHDALTRCRGELVGFGGHQAAAGVEVRAERVDALRAAWSDAFASVPAGSNAGEGDAEVRLDDRDDPASVSRDLYRLEPCGEKNRAPRILVPAARVLSARNLKGHLRVELSWPRGARGVLGGFGFEMGDRAERIVGERVDVLGLLRADTWRGGEAVELRVERVEVHEGRT